MLRRLMWTALMALAVIVARRLAAAVWRRALREEPPSSMA
jgi:hypothetical protein